MAREEEIPAGVKMPADSRFVHPSREILSWLVANGAKIDDIYRMTVKRDDHGGADLMFWQYARNKNGKRYAIVVRGNKEMARLDPVMIHVDKLPDCIKLDLYGEPIEEYGDDKLVT